MNVRWGGAGKPTSVHPLKMVRNDRMILKLVNECECLRMPLGAGRVQE